MNDVSVIDFVCEDDAVIAATLFHTVVYTQRAQMQERKPTTWWWERTLHPS